MIFRWEDYLQTPLQPLADNLDTHTYNVFEKDPIKYDQYQKAIAQALIDLEKAPSQVVNFYPLFLWEYFLLHFCDLKVMKRKGNSKMRPRHK